MFVSENVSILSVIIGLCLIQDVKNASETDTLGLWNVYWKISTILEECIGCELLQVTFIVKKIKKIKFII